MSSGVLCRSIARLIGLAIYEKLQFLQWNTFIQCRLAMACDKNAQSTLSKPIKHETYFLPVQYSRLPPIQTGGTEPTSSHFSYLV